MFLQDLYFVFEPSMLVVKYNNNNIPIVTIRKVIKNIVIV